MVLDVIWLILGMVCLIKGADFFVEGSSNVAKALKIPSIIIGLTLVSIGTSLPELSVSVNSALQGLDDMSFGNVIGSNIFNIFMVIGISALFTPMIVEKSVVKYDIPILIAIGIFVLIFGFAITPGTFSRFESIILLLMFICYMVFIVLRSKKSKVIDEKQEETKNKKWYINLLFIVVGLAGIIGGGELVVNSAKKIAINLGMSELLVGLTIVSIGTSLPELVTSVVAARKKENDIAVGNAIGSSIFNCLLIIGVSSTITPLNVDVSSLLDTIVMIISALLIFIFTYKNYKINKIQGGVFVAIYLLYFVYIVLRNIYPNIFAF